MTLDRRILRLMAITGEPGTAQSVLDWARAAARGGATVVQLRAKRRSSREMLELTRALVAALDVPVIVNDRADIAIIGGAAGVHLGPDDLPVERVRAFSPPDFIVGASVGDDGELAGARGADYVGVGPVFATGSKEDAGDAIGPVEMGRLIRASGCPGVGIGGITAQNAAEVIRAGADGVAVLSALQQDPEGVARSLAAASGK